jgi:hypothetical protein
MSPSTLTESRIERAADTGQNRLLVAEQSQTRWYQREQTRLVSGDLDLRLAVAREDDPVKRGALQAQLAENGRQLEEVSAGMKRSSLRAGLGRAAENVIADTGMIEARIVASPPSDSLPISAAPAISGSGQVKTKINGLAAVYDSPAIIAGCFREIILSGAFKEVIKTCDCRCLYNHDSNWVFGRTASESLRLYESPTAGLIYWCDLLDDDAMAATIIKRVTRKDVSGCSFAFRVGEDSWQLPKRPGELDTRYIKTISELFDVSVVTYPAYPQTSVQIVHERSAQEKAADETRHYFEQAEREEWAAEDRERVEHKNRVEKDYRLAGRIIGRCRA